MARREPQLDQQIERVRRLLDEVQSCLPARRLDEVEELLRNGEPGEALLGIAWDLVPHVDELPEQVGRLIRDEVGSGIDLPVAFRDERRRDR